METGESNDHRAPEYVNTNPIDISRPYVPIWELFLQFEAEGGILQASVSIVLCVEGQHLDSGEFVGWRPGVRGTG